MANFLEGLIHALASFVDIFDSKGGHIVIALIIFFAGVSMMKLEIADGKEVMAGALSAMYFAMKSERTANGVGKKNES